MKGSNGMSKTSAAFSLRLIRIAGVSWANASRGKRPPIAPPLAVASGLEPAAPNASLSGVSSAHALRRRSNGRWFRVIGRPK